VWRLLKWLMVPRAPTIQVRMMADDVIVSWVAPTQTRFGSALDPADILGFKLYERLPDSTVQMIRDIPGIQRTLTMLDYASENRAYEFAMSCYTAIGEGKMSSFSSDTVDDYPGQMAPPEVTFVPK